MPRSHGQFLAQPNAFAIVAESRVRYGTQRIKEPIAPGQIEETSKRRWLLNLTGLTGFCQVGGRERASQAEGQWSKGQRMIRAEA